MRKMRWLGLILLVGLPLGQAHAQGWRKDVNDVGVVNTKLAGKVIDYTANHGKDNRMWSPALYQRRDLYVYLPPDFQPCQRYPLMIWLHGFCQDEKVFLHRIAPMIDQAIKDGKLPPMIVAAPDGSLSGEPHPSKVGSFFLNSDAGDFADFVLYDVFDFVTQNYPVRPEREAHILAGCSMGGFAAYNYGIKHREAFGVVMGISPPLNLRWQNTKGDYWAKFDPKDWGWRVSMGPALKPIARVMNVLDSGRRAFLSDWFEPLYGAGDAPITTIALENPIEMVARYQLHPGELEMYVAYTGNDEFNIAAQVESFVYLTKWYGLRVKVDSEQDGRHDIHTFMKLLPGALEWLTPRIAPFSPLLPHDDTACGPACGGNGCVTPCVASPPCPCPGGNCAQPKYRPAPGKCVPPCPNCDDLNCHLPPMWLPERATEEPNKK